MIPPKLFIRVQESRSSANSLVDSAIGAIQETVGIGEWEFMALILTLTVIFHVLKLTSNVALITLEK